MMRARQALLWVLPNAALLLALLTIANAAFHDPSVHEAAYNETDANMCLTDAGLHAINAATANVTLPGDASLVVAAAKLYLWAKPLLVWLQTLERAKLRAANGTSSLGATLLPNTFIHSKANKYFWSNELPSLGHVPSVVSLDMSSGPVTIKLPSKFSSAYMMSVLDSEFNVLATYTSHDLHQYKKASDGSFVFAVLAPGQALKDKTDTTIIRSPTPMAMALVRTMLLQRNLNTTAADPVQDAMSASGDVGPLSRSLMSPQMSAAIRGTSLGPVDLLRNATTRSFNLFLAIQLAAQAGFFDTRTSPFMSAATVLSSVLPALGYPAGVNTTQANLTADQLAILAKGTQIGHNCVIKASQGFWTRASGAWFSFEDPDATTVTADADAGILASLVPAVRFYRWFFNDEDVDGLQRTFWAAKDKVGLPLSKTNSYSFKSPPTSPGMARFLSVYDPVAGTAMLSPDSAPVFIPVTPRPGASNLTNMVRVGLADVVKQKLVVEGAPFVPRNFISLSPRSAMSSVTTFMMVFRFVALRRSVLSSGSTRKLLRKHSDPAPGGVTPSAGPSSADTDMLGYVKKAGSSDLIGTGYNVLTGIPILGACPVAASWTSDPGLTKNSVLKAQPDQVDYDTDSSCSGSYETGFHTSKSSYQSSSYNSVSLSAGYLLVSASTNNVWSSSMNNTYSSSNAYTTLHANCIVGHATYNSDLMSSSANKQLLSPLFVDAITNVLYMQLVNEFVPPKEPTTTCLPAYFDKEISELFDPAYSDCYWCTRDRSTCSITCACNKVDGTPIYASASGALLLNKCLGGKLFNVQGHLQCVAGFPTNGGCTYMATSLQSGGFPAGNYLIDVDANRYCTFTTSKTQCYLDCTSGLGGNAWLNVSQCVVNYMPYGDNQWQDFYNKKGSLECTHKPATSGSDQGCESYPGYKFYAKFSGGDASMKDTTYANKGLQLGELASKCDKDVVGCIGFDTTGNLWLYLSYNKFTGAYGSFSPDDFSSNYCGGIYISENWASTSTLNAYMYSQIFNIYGTHYVKKAAFGSSMNQCITTSSASQSIMSSSSFETANSVAVSYGGASVEAGLGHGSTDGSSSSSKDDLYQSKTMYVPGILNLNPIFPKGTAVIDSTAFSQQTAAAIAAAGHVQAVAVTADSLSSLIVLPGPAAQILEAANKQDKAPEGGFKITHLQQLASLMDNSMVFKYDDRSCKVAGGFPCYPV